MRQPALMNRDTIVADDIRLDAAGPDAVLSCRVRSGRADLPPRLWFRVPAALAPHVAANGDPFFPVLLGASMSAPTRLVLEADVSAALLDGSRRVMAVFEQRSAAAGHGLTAPEVSAPGAVRTTRGSSSGAFFSGGVDSFFTLLRNHGRYPPDEPRRIRYVLLIHGFDIPLAAEGAFDDALRHARDVTDALGITLVPVRTNARDLLTSLDWHDYAHGPVLASVGLSFQKRLHTLYIPATRWSGAVEPRGASHPEIDLLWSTETLEFIHDGIQADRFEKVRFLSTSPLALRSLRVCWENHGTAYNCGHCEKCLRTMFSLAVLGVLDRAETFPAKIDDRNVDGLILTSVERAHWRTCLEAGHQAGMDPVLLHAAERAMARGKWAESRAGRLDSALSAMLSRTGLTGATVKHWDRRLSGGTGTRLFRWLQLALGSRRGP